MIDIVRGTTPTVSFGLPFSADLLAAGFVTVRQLGETVIEKEMSACVCDGSTLAAKFSQEDTLALKIGSPAKIRLVVKTQGGDRLETKDIVARVSDTHKDGVI